MGQHYGRRRPHHAAGPDLLLRATARPDARVDRGRNEGIAAVVTGGAKRVAGLTRRGLFGGSLVAGAGALAASAALRHSPLAGAAKATHVNEEDRSRRGHS